MPVPAFLRGVKKLTWAVGIVAVLLFVVGICLFSFSWLIEAEIESYVDSSLYKQIIVDAYDADGYEAWANNWENGHAILYQVFYLYNITNVNELVNGATRVHINQVGPYAYISHKQKIDVSFSDNGNKVSYLTWKSWLFQPDLSCAGCKETDVVFNMNPAYVGALAQTGGELELIVALTGPTLQAKLFTFLWGPFTQDMLSQWRPPIISDAKQAIVESKPQDPQYFYTNWANTTNIDSPLWNGMLVSSVSGQPSGISLTSAEALWDATVPLSLLDGTLGSAKVWRRASQNDTQAISQLKTTFTLTDAQLSSLFGWLNASCNPTLVTPNFTESFALSSIEDAAFLQWGGAVLTERESVQTLYPEMNFPMEPELSLFMYNSTFASLSVDASKMLLDGPYGLFNAMNLKDYLAAVEARQFGVIMEKWGIDWSDVVITGAYFGSVTLLWARPTLDDLLAQGNGLFANRTIHQWLWDMTDPLIELLSPASAQVGLVVNQTSPDMTRAMHKPDLCLTGKSDVNKIGDYIKWEDETELVGVYTTTIPITGTNDAGQFKPFLKEDTLLYTFDDNYLRELTLVPMGYLDIKGVNTLRYELSNATWQPSALYDQPIAGFANISGSKNGAPVYLSNSHMYLCDPTYVDKVRGMKELQNVTFDTIVIDIEPISGAVIHYSEALQVNIYLDPKNAGWFNWYHGNIRSDIFYPIMVGSEYSVLTDSDASKIKDNLYFGIKMESTLFYVALGVGLGLFVLSLPLLGFFGWKYRKDRRASTGGYQFVQDDGSLN